MQTTLFAQGHNIFDREIPSQKDVEAGLEIAKRISVLDQLTPMDMLQLYKAEKKIGRCVWGISPRATDLTIEQQISISGCGVDSKTAAECVRYVQANQGRFRVVEDNWKGEENFCEPNRYWLERVYRTFPNSPEGKEIEFHLDFNEFIRHFDIDKSAKEKSCEQYVNEELKKSGYREVYSPDELKQWIPKCEQARKNFEIGKKRLLEKFQNAPFTKKLQEIDQTIIVVFYHVC